MAKISIIVPVYNTEKYLERCIKSILAQTLKDFQLILVNDGSTDQSGKICEEYATLDKRIKVIHKSNGGLSDARNYGLDIATGDFIGFVDSDDFIEVDMYENLYNACIKNDVKLSVCGRFDVLENEKIPIFTLEQEEVWTNKKAIKNLLLWNNIDSSACDKLFRKDLFKDVYFPLGKYNEDIFIIPNIIHEAQIIAHTGEPKYNYYHRENSITKEDFTERKMDLLEATESLGVLVNLNYPEYNELYDAFYYNGLIFLNSIIQSKSIKSKNYKHYKFLRKKIIKNIYSILTSKYLNNKVKAKTLLLLFKIYTPAETLIKLRKKN